MSLSYIAASHLLNTVLTRYLGNAQRTVLQDLIFKGEERQFFRDKVAELATLVTNMPKTYEQDGLGDKAIVYLHYFGGSFDAYITEKDVSADEDDGHHQAFGMINGEYGYISIPELLRGGLELDLYWTPKTVAQIKAR